MWSRMVMPRLKKMVSLALDPDLLDRLERFLDRQDPKIAKTAVFETALRRFLDDADAPKAKGRGK